MSEIMMKDLQSLSLRLKEILRMSSFYSEELIAEKILTLIEKETGIPLNVLDAISIPIYVKDLNGLIVYANKAYGDLIQLPLEQITDRHLSELSGNTVESVDIHKRMDLELERIRKPLIYEYEYRRRDATTIPVYIFKDLLLNEECQPYLIIGSIVNISHFKDRIQGYDRLKHAKTKIFERSKGLAHRGIREIADFLVQVSIELLNKPLMGSFIILDRENEMVWVTGAGYDLESLKGLTLEYKNSLQWMVGKDLKHEIIRIDDMRDFPEMMPKLLLNEVGQSIKSLVSIPLMVDNRIFAFISIESNDARAFNSIDIELLSILKNDYEFLIDNYLLRQKLDQLKVLDGDSGLLNRMELETFIDDKVKMADLRGCLIQFELLAYDQLIDLLGWKASENIIKQIVETIKKTLHTLQIGYRLDRNKFVFYSKVMDESFEREIYKAVNQIYYNGVQCEKGMVHLPISASNCILEQALNQGEHFSKHFIKTYEDGSNIDVKSRPMFFES